MSKRNRWKLILVLLQFMCEASDKTLLNVAQYAAEQMADEPEAPR